MFGGEDKLSYGSINLAERLVLVPLYRKVRGTVDSLTVAHYVE